MDRSTAEPSSSGRDIDQLHVRTPSLQRNGSVEPGSRGGWGARTRRRAEPFFIGVAGGTASGKTTVCGEIIQRLHDQCVVMLAQDSFYRDLTEHERQNLDNYNFDAPAAFDAAAIQHCLEELKAMRAVEVPVYDYTHHRRSQETRRVEPSDVVIIEGILVLHMTEVLEMLNMRVFVDTDDDVRLARRIQRDVATRGRDIVGVLRQYTDHVKPAFDTFIMPSRKRADIIIPWIRQENVVAIDLITEHIRMKLQQPDLQRMYHNLQVVPSNFQTRGMHTIIRDRDTTTADFAFYADRLLRLVVEAGLGHLPFAEKTVCTPTGAPYVGVDFAKRLCGVSIIRSGESMENALRACCKGIKIGKILVYREKHRPDKSEVSAAFMRRAASQNFSTVASSESMEQELVYEKLPADIAARHVLLMDAVLATGHSAQRAINVLTEKGVHESNILFLSLIAAPEGIHKLCSRYPRIKVITSEIDDRVDDDSFQVLPGVGEFGDRYFCS